MKVIEYTKGVADLNENIQKTKPKRQMINCVNEDDEQGHNANNDGNHHLVISGNGHSNVIAQDHIIRISN